MARRVFRFGSSMAQVVPKVAGTGRWQPFQVVQRVVFGACAAARVAESAARGDQGLVNRRDSRLFLQPSSSAQYGACASARMETRGRRDLQIPRKAGWREVKLVISVPRIYGCKHPQRELNKQNSVALILTCGFSSLTKTTE